MPYTTDSRDFDHLVSQAEKLNPISFLAEGDSWFAYPRQFIIAGPASNIVQVLGRKKRYVIYSTACNGDEAVTMMTGDQKFAFTKRVMHTKFDIILFSGGGNDIVGKYDFDFFLKPRSTSPKLEDCIEMERLDNKLRQIRSVYVELIERTLQYSMNKDIKIITHTYDYAVPDEKGYELFDLIPIGDSWIYPYLMEKGFEKKTEQRKVIKLMLSKFRDEIKSLQKIYRKVFFVVNTQGTLNDNQWRNEIHPTPGGFNIISKMIDDKIKAVTS